MRAAKEVGAGSIAGMASLVVCYPMDIVRTRLQTTDATRFKGVLDCFVQTVKNEGFLALYKGMASPLAAQALQKAIMFGAYGAAQRMIQQHKIQKSPSGDQQLTIGELFVCGMVAGAANTVVAAPIELVRNRLMVQYHSLGSGSHYSGPLDCFKQIIKEKGIVGLWKGLGPTLLRDAPGVGAWYACFEITRRMLIPEGKTARDVGFAGLLVSGAMAGVGYWVTAFPQDTIKSVMQTDKDGRYRNSLHCAVQLVKEGGLARLYRGFMMGITRGIPGAATTFTTYGMVMKLIER